MSTSEQPVLSIRCPADVLAVTPYVLGYHPSDSIVILGLSDTRIVFAARTDLPDSDDDPDTYAGSVANVAGIAARQATEAMLIGYGTAEAITPVIDLARRCLALNGLPVREALRLTDGRYYSYICTNPQCCPPDGTPFDPVRTPAAQAVVAGLVALPSRNDLVASITPYDGQRHNDMTRAVATTAERLATDVSTAYDSGGTDAAHALLHEHGIRTLRQATGRYRERGTLSDDEAATLLLLLRYLPVRDHALRHADPADLPLWTDLTRRAPDDLVPAPATLLAYTALRKGTGALANIALDRALTGDPDYNLAHLLRAAIRVGLPPNLLHERLAEAYDTNPE